MAEKKYIELQKALSVCEMHYEHCLEMHDWSGDATADNIKRDIETLPAADVVEVVHARWEKTHDDPRVNKYRCTNCKAEKMRDNYCPSCGAKMDGATDNNVGDKGR